MQELRVCVYDAGAGARVGGVADDRVYDLNLCCAQQVAAEERTLEAYRLANRRVPADLGTFLRGGADVMAVARRALTWVRERESREGPAGEALFHSLHRVKLRAPVLPSTKVLCMALSFKSHADIGGKTPHPFPRFFTKMSQVVVGPEDWVILPRHHADPVVYGSELTVVIGKEGRSIPEERADELIWGYTILNDMTLRGRPGWLSAHKSFETAAPVGPWIVPRDQIPDPQNVELSFRINGEVVQRGNTRDMIFPVRAIVSEVSKWFRLIPGDLIATGDVGATQPLKPGDIMEAVVEGIGVLSNPVRLEA
ncbi:MAG: fumarylacetoacetate hydrolase family protein [Gemmatimonadetes bacterium]|nr:fumarylacetoacetate hydrolase family protein [Gemmatimonadota bacterium]